MVATSMGGAVSVSYLTSPSCPIKACVINQSPFDVQVAIKSAMSKACGAYNIGLGLKIRNDVMLKHKEMLLRNPVFRACATDENGRLRVPSTIGEIDSQITCKVAGFKSRDEYYAAGSTLHKLKDIKMEAMLLCAENDPILGLKEAIPY